MKFKNAVLDKDGVVAHIYEHEKHGLVIVWQTNKINIEERLAIYEMHSTEQIEDEELRQIINETMPFLNKVTR
mgnify:CR=1 FL=1